MRAAPGIFIHPPKIAMPRTAEELSLFIDYAVRAEEIAQGKNYLARCRDNQKAVALIGEYYTNLPDISDEALIAIKILRERRGLGLFVLQTASRHYFAVSDGEEARILGEYPVEELPGELLAHFGFKDNAAFQSACLDAAQLADLASGDSGAHCPACGVAEGEKHLLGCPVEICPWCDGQLIRCDCRFEQLGIEEIDGENRLQAFEDMLEAKGRIPYARQHSPSYPGTSAGLDQCLFPLTACR